MQFKLLSTALLLALTATTGNAATRIDIKNPEGVATVYIDGARSRMDNGEQGYMILDSQANSMQLVMPAQRQVIDMSFALHVPQPGSESVKLNFTKTGTGPRIAGYETSRYNFSADDQQCGSLLGSTAALKDAKLGEALEMMEKMAKRSAAMVSSFRAVAPCERATTALSQYAAEVGLPMRVTIGKQVLSEIVRLEPDARLPPNTFTVPAGYQRQNPAQMMQGAQRLMQQMQQSGQ